MDTNSIRHMLRDGDRDSHRRQRRIGRREVNASRTAYAIGVPDGTIGTAIYVPTLVHSAAGGYRGEGAVAGSGNPSPHQK